MLIKDSTMFSVGGNVRLSCLVLDESIRLDRSNVSNLVLSGLVDVFCLFLVNRQRTTDNYSKTKERKRIHTYSSR